MSISYGKRDDGRRFLNRSQVARTIFTAAESMGMSDRQQIEQLTR